MEGSALVALSGALPLSSATTRLLSPLRLAALIGLYAGLGYIGLQFDDGSGLVPLIWPAAGLAAALVLAVGLQALWLPAIGNLLLLIPASLHYGNSWSNAIAIALGAAAANTGAVWLIHRLSGGYGPRRLFDSVAFLRFVLIAAPLASLFSAVVGVATLVAFASRTELDPLTRMALWWSGDMVGCLLLAPMLISWPDRETERRHLLEFGALASGCALYLVLLLITFADLPGANALLAPLGLPLLFVAILRLRLFALNGLLALIGLAFVLAHFHGAGPFQFGQPVLSHLALQIFLMALLATTMLAATLLRERRRLHQALLEANRNLEQDVRNRTAASERQSRRLRDIITVLPLHLSVRKPDGELQLGNRAIPALTEQEVDWLASARAHAAATGVAVRDVFGTARDRDGETLQIQAQVVPLVDDDQAVLIVAQDVTERMRRQRLEQLHTQVFQRLAEDASLASVLSQIVQAVEQLEPTMMASILLVDHQRGVLRHGAAGRLPLPFSQSVDGLPFAVGVGSCGNTAATGERTVVADINQHPFWAPYRELAAQTGLASCWSEPIKDHSGAVVATFALYSPQVGEPTPWQRRLIASIAALVQLAIERHRHLQHVRLLSRALEQTASAVLLCDAAGHIEYANASFYRMLRWSTEQACGHNALELLLTADEEGQLVRAAILEVVSNGTGWHGEFVGRRSDNSTLWLHASIAPLFTIDGQLEKQVTVLEDISSFKTAQATAEYLAFHDALTGLGNRRLFLQRLDEDVRRLRRAGGMSALLFFDLDEFKRINDTLGHNVGDELLKQIAERLLASVREDDLVARLGGDEFCLLLGNLHDSVEAGTLARKLMSAIEAPMQLAEHTLSVSCSVGITLLPIDGDKAEVLLRNADLAMYRAKAEGRNRFVFFAPEMNDVSRERLQLETELRRALGRQQFLLHFQPIVGMTDGALSGYEVLVRWQHPERGLLAPDTFVPVAEHTGLIVPIGEEVLVQALAALAQIGSSNDHDNHNNHKRTNSSSDNHHSNNDNSSNDNSSNKHGTVRLSVNVSARQLREPDFGARVAALMRQHDVAPGRLQLEITESLLLERSAITEQNLEALVASGARIVIDDFGTGYTSFNQLRDLPIHGIKLDRVFVRELPGNEDDAAIVAALIAMAKQLQLDVVAEGVETEAQRDFLVAHGCQLGQGWLFGKPAPLR